MKFIVNSKTLHDALSQADFDEVHVADVSLKQSVLSIIFSDYKDVEVVVESLEGNSNLSQPNVRWDFLVRTLVRLPEQPIVISLKGSGLTLTFAY